ncbi:aldehyde dehydrogenase (NAD+) [Arboricoccus pini]|uniref:Aldehyde dehydrogenase (NAD+) n=1 Tax=Arboricoccus pini TaxID=1963835 RepID=A0A212RL50_9PROT|nr:aldehyde dehydrogenase family protein [Arboricoccus pini]SNB73135.1 aldehyde dehydrogenase (NAD+) [Arboricoccus pini]
MSLDFDPSSLSIPKGHHIGGRYIDFGGEPIEVRRPSDLQVMGTLEDGGEEAVEAAVQAARQALKASNWSKIAPIERARVLTRFAELVEQRSLDLARLEAANSTRLIAETTVRDAARTAGTIRFFAEYCDKLEGQTTQTQSGILSMVRPEPYGIVAAIVPWNFPMITAAWKFAPALAAGNAILIKTSELTPYTLLLLAEIATEAGLPKGLFNVVNGYGQTTGAALVRHRSIGKISFTGSTATGVAIMTLAASHGTKPVTLELGGKSPQLIFADNEDLDALAAKVAAGFMGNGGQVCTAGSRLIIQRKIADELVEKIEARCRAITPGPTWREASDFPPIINEKQLARIDSLVQKTLAEGATARVGGSRLETRNEGSFYAPTLLEGVTPEMTGYQEEFFGPIASIHRFDEVEEGIAMADHPTYGLAASIFTTDIKKALLAAEQIESGMVWVNQNGRGPEFTFPAGGFKGSGFGKDMGRVGIETYTRQKAVWINYAA